MAHSEIGPRLIKLIAVKVSYGHKWVTPITFITNSSSVGPFKSKLSQNRWHHVGDDWATRELFSDRLQHIFTKSELIQTRCMCVHGFCFSFRRAAGAARALFRIWPSKEWTCAASQKIKLCRRHNDTETQIIWNLLALRVSGIFYMENCRRVGKIEQCLLFANVCKQANDLILDIFIEEQRDELWASAVLCALTESHLL